MGGQTFSTVHSASQKNHGLKLLRDLESSIINYGSLLGGVKTTNGAVEVILQHINPSNSKAHLKLRRHELFSFLQFLNDLSLAQHCCAFYSRTTICVSNARICSFADQVPN